MRTPFTVEQAAARGLSRSMLKTRVKNGRIQRLAHGVYIEGGATPTALERAMAVVIATGGIAMGTLAAALHGLDGIYLRPPFAASECEKRRRHVVQRHFVTSPVVDVDGYRCTDGLQTMLDLAALLDETRWEQALESALRKRLVTIEALNDALRVRRVGNKKIRRILNLRGDLPPTESFLETLMVQLLRNDQRLPEPSRQFEVYRASGTFVARVDLAWPELGVFLELDGSDHKDQSVYDATRQTAVTVTTGWRVGRFTWDDVRKRPNTTLRRVAELLTPPLYGVA